MPALWLSQYSLWNGVSVAACCVTSNCSGVSFLCSSASDGFVIHDSLRRVLLRLRGWCGRNRNGKTQHGAEYVPVQREHLARPEVWFIRHIPNRVSCWNMYARTRKMVLSCSRLSVAGEDALEQCK